MQDENKNHATNEVRSGNVRKGAGMVPRPGCFLKFFGILPGDPCFRSIKGLLEADGDGRQQIIR